MRTELQHLLYVLNNFLEVERFMTPSGQGYLMNLQGSYTGYCVERVAWMVTNRELSVAIKNFFSAQEPLW